MLPAGVGMGHIRDFHSLATIVTHRLVVVLPSPLLWILSPYRDMRQALRRNRVWGCEGYIRGMKIGRGRANYTREGGAPQARNKTQRHNPFPPLWIPACAGIDEVGAGITNVEPDWRWDAANHELGAAEAVYPRSESGTCGYSNRSSRR